MIDAAELDMMRECVRDVPAEVELLDKWYKKDANTVPPVYILQPISTILTNFNNKVNHLYCLHVFLKTLLVAVSYTWYHIIGADVHIYS